MNANIPGFTAEASLYQVDERYHMMKIPDAFANSQKIMPQAICIALPRRAFLLVTGIDSEFGGFFCWR